MKPVRDMVRLWGERQNEFAEAMAKIEETAIATAAMKALLEKLNRKVEIDEEVKRRMDEEELKRQARERDKERAPRRT